MAHLNAAWGEISAFSGRARPTSSPVSHRVAGGNDVDPLSRLLAYVSAMETPDHGWATAAGRESDAESTAWVLVGASMLPALADHRDTALAWLVREQQKEGNWAYRPGPAIATWPTAPALIGMTMADVEVEVRETATAWLVREHSATPSRWQRTVREVVARLKPDQERLVVQDETLDGFGWAQETVAWVEPTAIAMIALALQPRTPALTQRVTIGAQLLLDRQSSDGGWNYGNKRVLGVDLPGYPDTTAWALLGLAAAVRSGIVSSSLVEHAVARGFMALARSEVSMPSPLAMALRLLARSAHRFDEVAGRPALLARLRASLASALSGIQNGYPMLDTRGAILALLSLHDIDLLALVPR